MQETFLALWRALDRFDPGQRGALFLAYFRGLPYREVARVSNVPEGTAKTRLRDGLRALRTSLDGSVAV